MRTESRTMPMNSRTCEGPIVLDATTGALSDMKTRSNVLKFSRHSTFEGSAIKNRLRCELRDGGRNCA